MPVVSDFRAILGINENDDYTWNGNTDLGTPVIVTYDFLQGADLPSPSETSYPTTSTSAFNAAQKQNFREVAQIYESLAGVVFVEVEGNAMLNIHAADGSDYGGWATYAYASTSRTNSGNFVIDRDGDFDQGTYAFQVLLHELGHAMGLQHPHEGAYQLAGGYDSQAYTVMTYNISAPYLETLAILDIEALNHLYGAPVDATGWTMGWNGARDRLEILAGAADDFVNGGKGDNFIRGRGGDDTLIGRENADLLSGGGGQDLIIGGEGYDDLRGGAGKDRIYGDLDDDGGWNGGRDRLSGGKGNDRLFGGAYEDHLRGNAGNDRLFGGYHFDTLEGGAGDDRLFGGNYGDTLFGGNGDDELSGDASSDTLSGGRGTDRLFGGDGADTLDGGAGDDILFGGSNGDYFVFGRDTGRDRLRDFDAFDRIDLRGTGLTMDDLSFSARGGGADTLLRIGDTGMELLVRDVAVDQWTTSDFVT